MLPFHDAFFLTLAFEWKSRRGQNVDQYLVFIFSASVRLKSDTDSGGGAHAFNPSI